MQSNVLKSLSFGLNFKNTDKNIVYNKEKGVSVIKSNISSNKDYKNSSIKDNKNENLSLSSTFPDNIKLYKKLKLKLLKRKDLIIKNENIKDLKKKEENESKIYNLNKKIDIIKDSIISSLNINCEKNEVFEDDILLTNSKNKTNTVVINPLFSFKQIAKYCNIYKTEFIDIIKDEYRFSYPSPIQSCVVPYIYNDCNLIATSATGSGKTLAYLIPILSKLKFLKSNNINKKAIIIAPTKELCLQIFNDANILSNYICKSYITVKNIKKSVIDSISNNNESYNNFISNNNIFIGTSDLILELLTLYTSYHIKLFSNKSKNNNNKNKYNILVKKLKYIVFDEADKLFESISKTSTSTETILNIIQDFENKKLDILIKKTNRSKTSNFKISKCFFSATINSKISDILESKIINFKKIQIGSCHLPCSSINQVFKYCTNFEGKLIEIKNYLKYNLNPPILVFVDQIETGKKVFESLKYDVVPNKINLLHSQMSKESREELIKKLRLNSIWVLVTSDLLARGIDFKNINTVINFDCPESYSVYIHRVGRTGRAGNIGTSVTYITDKDKEDNSNMFNSCKLKKLKSILNSSNVDCPEWMKKC